MSALVGPMRWRPIAGAIAAPASATANMVVIRPLVLPPDPRYDASTSFVRAKYGPLLLRGMCVTTYSGENVKLIDGIP